MAKNIINILLNILIFVLLYSLIVWYNGGLEEREIYTTEDIIYVERGLFYTKINTESTDLNLYVRDYVLLEVLEELSDPSRNRKEYFELIDSLQNRYD